MKTKAAHLPVQGGWRRGVYGRSRVFRIRNKKGANIKTVPGRQPAHLQFLVDAIRHLK